MRKIIRFFCSPLIVNIGTCLFGLSLIVSVVTFVLALTGHFSAFDRLGYIVSTVIFLLTLPYGVYTGYQESKKRGTLPSQKKTEM